MEREKRLFVTVNECVELTGVCKSKIYELVKAGAWPSVKFGTAIRIPLAGLEALASEAVESVSR